MIYLNKITSNVQPRAMAAMLCLWQGDQEHRSVPSASSFSPTSKFASYSWGGRFHGSLAKSCHSILPLSSKKVRKGCRTVSEEWSRLGSLWFTIPCHSGPVIIRACWLVETHATLSLLQHQKLSRLSVPGPSEDGWHNGLHGPHDQSSHGPGLLSV